MQKILAEVEKVQYALLFTLTFFCLTTVTILLDFIQQRVAKRYHSRAIRENRAYLYIHVFKTLAQVALLWLIVSFIGQIWMGWIKF